MLILIIILWLAMAATFPLGKLALTFSSSPLQLIGLRMSIAGALTLGTIALQFLFGFKKLEFKSVSRSDLGLFGLVSLLHVYLAFVPEFWALQFVDSIKANLLFSLTPFISAFLSFIFLSHKISQQKWAALGLGLCGMLAITFGHNPMEASMKSFFSISLPEFVLMIGISSACLAWFVIRRLMHRGYDLLTINGVAFLIGGLLSLLHFFILNPGQSLIPESNSKTFFILIGALIFCSNIIGFNLYGKLLHIYSNTFLSFTGFLSPLFGAFISIGFACLFPQYFIKETILTSYLVGYGLILAGLSIFYSQEIKEIGIGFFK